MKTTNLNAPFAMRAAYINSTGLNSNLNAIGLIGATSDSTANLIEKIENKKGQISTVTMISDLDSSMKKRNNPFFGRGFFKLSRFQIRFGVSYENKASTIEKREEGKLPEPPRGKIWIQFPYWMVSEKTNEILVACSSVKNSNSKRYFLNADFEEIDSEIVKPFLKASSDFTPDWYTIGLKKILRVV